MILVKCRFAHSIYSQFFLKFSLRNHGRNTRDDVHFGKAQRFPLAVHCDILESSVGTAAAGELELLNPAL